MEELAKVQVVGCFKVPFALIEVYILYDVMVTMIVVSVVPRDVWAEIGIHL